MRVVLRILKVLLALVIVEARLAAATVVLAAMLVLAVAIVLALTIVLAAAIILGAVIVLGAVVLRQQLQRLAALLPVVVAAILGERRPGGERAEDDEGAQAAGGPEHGVTHGGFSFGRRLGGCPLAALPREGDDLSVRRRPGAARSQSSTSGATIGGRGRGRQERNLPSALTHSVG